MLELRHIRKTYETETLHQVALNDTSIAFREQEFVSILGPSGSGKTTMLNIIGGLDQYDSGDLIINGVSTKEYDDRDWDTYRNHSVGFVFQSYNLIGHQSILANVELALTLSGVNKKERKTRALQALEQVGLKDHINKKPNQLSGGQMQRVAIARALVNDPDIVLADEPTGALDSETSVQIMELLKEVSKTRLVIMVTHNPELAEQYSSRIVRLKDGSLLDDSNPYTPDKVENAEKPKKKTSMSFFTALSLSFNNLLTKKGRTALTAFAGSIGIIGIALILAISTGVNNYIAEVQTDTLSSFPIQINKESTDMSSLMSSLLNISPAAEGEETEEREGVYANPIMYEMMKTMLNADVTTNNLSGLKEYFDNNYEQLSEYSSAVQYGYNPSLNIYAKDPNGEYAKADFIDLINEVIEGGSMMSGISSVLGSTGSMEIWQELLVDPSTGGISSLISDQYELVYGKWPEEKNELLLVLTENNEISDVTLYSLGLVDKDTMMNASIAAMLGKEDDGWNKYAGKSWTYEEICDIPLKMILPTDYYQYDETTELWVDISDNQALLNTVINKGLELKVAGIIKPSEDATTPFLRGSLCYTKSLTDWYMEQLNNTEMVKEQKENVDTNIITGLPFLIEESDIKEDSEKAKAFNEYVKDLTDREKAALYTDILSTPKESDIQEAVDELIGMYDDKEAEDIVNDIVTNYASELGYSEDMLRSMMGGYSKDELIDLLGQTVREMFVAQYAEQGKQAIEEIKATPNDAEIVQMQEMILAEMYKDISVEADEMTSMMAQAQIKAGVVAQQWTTKTGMSIETAQSVIMTMSSEEIEAMFESTVRDMAIENYAAYSMMSSSADQDAKVAHVFDTIVEGADDQTLAYYYDNNMPDKVSDKTHKEILDMLGVADKADPDFIYIYPTNFEMKENIADMIADYNSQVDEDNQIEYTDMAAMLMSSVSNIITAISVVLICFVSISLVVSSIMIGIITYISVLERTKEIGILRAVGASKKDVSRVFNAETMIVGLLAGLVGIVSTVLLCIPFSLVARNVTGINSLTAVLPWYGYLLIVLSVGLTLIAGLFPAGLAAKKDPVTALRSE